SRTATVGADATGLEATKRRDPPWFARLPPEQQHAIRSDARRRPPRGYEERLKRYYQSIDR
ncbi:MAG: hypothetical protein WD176_07345, partial [Pirellulales bacterium]